MSDVLVWGEEGGRLLHLRRDGRSVVFEVCEARPGEEPAVLASVTVASFRHQRLIDFMIAEPQP